MRFPSALHADPRRKARMPAPATLPLVTPVARRLPFECDRLSANHGGDRQTAGLRGGVAQAPRRAWPPRPGIAPSTLIGGIGNGSSSFLLSAFCPGSSSPFETTSACSSSATPTTICGMIMSRPASWQGWVRHTSSTARLAGSNIHGRGVVDVPIAGRPAASAACRGAAPNAGRADRPLLLICCCGSRPR